jgi:electron transfer flavoprotein alpha subunit
MQRTTAPSDFKGIMVCLEQTEGQLARVSLEILGKAQELASKLATSVTGVILCNGAGKLVEDAYQFGADRVLVVNSPALNHYTTDAFCNVLSQVVNQQKPEILLLGATYDGRDLAGHLAIRLNTGLMSHAIKVEIDSETNLLVCTVPEFGGSILAACKCPNGRPQMATVRPGVFAQPHRNPTRHGQMEQVSVHVGEVRTKIVERSTKLSDDITGSELVVIAGQGAETQLDVIKKFAELAGGVVGVTRPVADKMLMTRDHQIGYTGCTVSPKVALILGASGATYFVSGIRGAKTIISVNKDDAAAINNYADFIVIDDINRVLPALVSRAQQR